MSQADSPENDPASKIREWSPERRALLEKMLGEQDDAGDSTANGEPQAIEPDPESLHEPFPLTDLQEAYWIGRGTDFALGNVAAHSYVELEGNFDHERLEAAWNALIARHGMMRAVIRPDGTQQILEEVPHYTIACTDLREAPAAEQQETVEAIRNRMSHQVTDVEEWPLFDVHHTLLGDDRSRLHVSLDALVFDGWSIARLFREWAELYRNPDADLAPIELSFRDYVCALEERTASEDYERDRAYWDDRLEDFPPAPDLPLVQDPESLDSVRFTRRQATLDASTWRALKQRARDAGLTPTGLLLSAYAEVITLWSRKRRFSLNIPSFSREPVHEDVNQIVGAFASFSPLAVDNRGSESFEQRATRIQEQLWENLDHDRFSGVEIVRELARRRKGRSSGAMPVIFTGAAADEQSGDDMYITTAAQDLGEVVHAINQTPQVWLDDHVFERDGALHVDWDSVDALFPEALPRQMLDAYMKLLTLLAERDDIWHESFSTIAWRLIPDEQQERRATYNHRNLEIPDRVLPERITEQAASRPDQAAVVTANRTLTYEELADRSRRWAHLLRERGAQPNQPVAIIMEKGWEQIVATLGVLQAGAACLPIDPGLPDERIRYMLDHSGCEWHLTQPGLREQGTWADAAQTLVVGGEQEPPPTRGAIDPAADPDDLAYVLYTSGSTGQPKGVMLEHRGIVNAIESTNRRFEVGPDDTVLGLTPLHHDMSMYDIFGVLGAGGTLVLPDASGRRDPDHWSTLMRREGVTIWNSVPQMMEMMLTYADDNRDAVPDTLRLAFLGGDWIPLSLPDRLQDQAGAAQVVSVGGPTETTLWNIWYPVEEVEPDWNSIPYGYPIPNVGYHVLDEGGAPCPDHVPGELCCTGVGLARGYLNDEEETAESFGAHPRTGARMYRTGDLGRYRSDGAIEFMGRIDLQVQINGIRVELDEVDAALGRHDAVRRAVTVAAGDRFEDKQLVAFVVPENGTVDGESLRSALGRTLPDYMIPSVFVDTDQLPLTANGKVDRDALTDRAREVLERGARASASAPEERAPDEQTGVADRIVELAREVLDVDIPSLEVSLLDLGVNSMDMVRFGNALDKQFDRRPRIDELFRMETLQALVEYYEEQAAGPVRTGQTTVDSGGERHELLSSYDVINDPCKREEFRDSQPGIRRDLEDAPAKELALPADEETLRDSYARRETHRTYSLKPVSQEALGQLLSAYYQVTLDDNPKYRYASPGGLYPTQVYLHVKPGRVEDLGPGIYYYHPKEHHLLRVTSDVDIPRSIHVPYINAPIYDEAAFSIFFIADLDAIGPSYGERSMHFVKLEAGIMSHQLDLMAPSLGIGLCHIGSIDFEAIRPHFDLKDSHVLVHSMVGGRIEDGPSEAANDESGEASRTQRMIDRIKGLSEEEITNLIEANRDQ